MASFMGLSVMILWRSVWCRQSLRASETPEHIDEAALAVPLLTGGGANADGTQKAARGTGHRTSDFVEVWREVIIPVSVLALGVGVSCAALWVSVVHTLKA